ncbi:MAG TPA: hypothetical protein VGK87_07275 [Anaerolineae bacterium]
MVTGLLITIIGSISIIGLISQNATPIRPDMRGAAKLVVSSMQAGDLFVFQMPYTRYSFEYYSTQGLPKTALEPPESSTDGLQIQSGMRDRLIAAPYTNDGATTELVAEQLELLTKRANRIWLIESEPELWDERRMVREWFEKVMNVVTRGQFHGVAATLYQIR